MVGYQVDIEGIRRAGKAMASAGEQAGAVDIGEILSDVPMALPGSASSGVAESLADVWRMRITSWSDDAIEHGEDTVVAADTYVENEETAASDLGALRDAPGAS